MIIPQSPELGWTLLTIGAVGIIWMGVLEYQRLKHSHKKNSISKPKYLSLSVAAGKVRKEIFNFDKLHPHIVYANTGDSENSKCEYFALAILVLDGIDIYGIEPPSKTMKRLNKDELKNNGKFYECGDKFKPFKSNNIKYTDICILNNCLSKIIESLISEGRSMGNYVPR